MGVQLGIAPLEPERPPIGNRRQAAGTGQLLQPGSPGARSCGELAILRRVSDQQCARGAGDRIPGNRAAQRNRSRVDVACGHLPAGGLDRSRKAAIARARLTNWPGRQAGQSRPGQSPHQASRRRVPIHPGARPRLGARVPDRG